jgi:hypothetical protein
MSWLKPSSAAIVTRKMWEEYFLFGLLLKGIFHHCLLYDLKRVISVCFNVINNIVFLVCLQQTSGKLFMKFLQTNAPEKLLSFSATLSTSQQVKDELE